MELFERAHATNRLPAGDDVATTVRKSKRLYKVWWTTMPSVVFSVSFAALCLQECITTPWATFVIAPVASAVLGLISAVVYGFWASSLPVEVRKGVYLYIGTSIVWGPVVGVVGFYVAMFAVGIGAAVVSLLSQAL